MIYFDKRHRDSELNKHVQMVKLKVRENWQPDHLGIRDDILQTQTSGFINKGIVVLAKNKNIDN